MSEEKLIQEVGKGCDRICSKNKRLKFRWKWDYHWAKDKDRKPCQLSSAVLQNGWRLEAIEWFDFYEASVSRYDNGVANYRVDAEEATPDRPVLVTRLDAQLKAEELFEQIGKDIIGQCWQEGQFDD